MTPTGVIPSIVANIIKVGFKQFTAFDVKSSLGVVAIIQNATVAGYFSVGEAADAARTEQNDGTS